MGRFAAGSKSVAETFASRLRAEIGARRVLLFGSRARGRSGPFSDYDFLIVSPHFDGIRPLRRPVGLRRFWRESGGSGPLDLVCLTPEEFERAQEGINLVSTVLPEAIDLLASPETAATDQAG